MPNQMNEDYEQAEILNDCPNCEDLKSTRDEMANEFSIAVEEVQALKRKLWATEELADIARAIYREQMFAKFKIGSKEKNFDLKLHDALGRYNASIGIGDNGSH